MTIKDGGRAFPQATGDNKGMTLRDYFAARAMVKLIGFNSFDGKVMFDGGDAREAYRIADTMLRAREM